MDAGIVIGVLVAVVDHVIHSARTTGIIKVNKRSRSGWTPAEHQLLQNHAYTLDSPKIVTLEVAGNVFLGSSLGLLQRIMQEVGLELKNDDAISFTPVLKSPHTPAYLMMKDHSQSARRVGKQLATHRSLPQYLALDLTRLHNIDGALLTLIEK